MKHYYYPMYEGDTSVSLFSPVDGTVIGFTEEYDGDLYKGTLVGIAPDGHDAFWINIFHINLHQPLEIGERVTAGQELGTTAKISGSVTDVAVWVHTPIGHKLISFFQSMPDDVFQAYQARGMNFREDAIITKEERDADMLECEGDQFKDRGTLKNSVYFDPP